MEKFDKIIETLEDLNDESKLSKILEENPSFDTDLHNLLSATIATYGRLHAFLGGTPITHLEADIDDDDVEIYVGDSDEFDPDNESEESSDEDDKPLSYFGSAASSLSKLGRKQRSKGLRNFHRYS